MYVAITKLFEENIENQRWNTAVGFEKSVVVYTAVCLQTLTVKQKGLQPQ